MERLNLEQNQTASSKLRRVLGRIIPPIDPVVETRHGQAYNAPLQLFFPQVTRIRKSGRITEKTVIPSRYAGAIILPTVEFLGYPMPDFPTPQAEQEWKDSMVAQFEIPPVPGHENIGD